MTDEQWLWLYVNEIIDNEDKFEKMCPTCRKEATSNNNCIRCGKVLSSKNSEVFINPNFDAKRFERLKNDKDDIDTDLLQQIKKDGDHFGKKD